MRKETTQSTKSGAKGDTPTTTDSRDDSPNPEFSLEGEENLSTQAVFLPAVGGRTLGRQLTP